TCALPIYDFEPLAFQKGSEALSDDYVVVGEEYPGRHVTSFSGTTTLSVVPLPGLESIESVPPRLAARSLMPISPSPWLCVCADRALASKPHPLSAIEQTSASGWRTRRTTAWVACACLIIFVSASCTIRYTAVSTGPGRRLPIEAVTKIGRASCRERVED